MGKLNDLLAQIISAINHLINSALTKYDTSAVVDEKIAKAQLGAGGGSTTETVTKTLTADDFAIGALSSSTGEYTAHTGRVYTSEFMECTAAEPFKVVGNGTDMWRVFRYNNGTLIDHTSFSVKDAEDVTAGCSVPETVTHVKFVLAYNGNATVTDIADLVSRFTISRTYVVEVPSVDTSQFVMQSDLSEAIAKYFLRSKGKKLLIFGDSITETAEVSDDGTTYTEGKKSNWPTFAKEKLQVSEMWNYAKSGAKWTDFSTETVRQKLSHQIETAIANNRPADIIVVSAGTNNNNSGVSDTYDTAMSKDISDLDRTVFSEAVRWCMYTLRNAYPDAICFVATPVQRAAREIDKSLIDAIVSMAKRYNFIVIPAHDESGIVRDFEVSGGAGRDLSDGLHPNESGQKKIANLYCSYILRNLA